MQLRNSSVATHGGGSGGGQDVDKGISAAATTSTTTAPRQLDRFEYYMEKTYMKTASLIAKSCRAAAVLGGCKHEVLEAVHSYGRNLGLAFQLVDDMLDFVTSADEMGKPVNADLKLGLATAPVLYASEQHPQLLPLIERRFSKGGDAELALHLVHQSNGIQRTRELASSYCREAVNALSILPPSPAKTVLIQLTHSVLYRKK